MSTPPIEMQKPGATPQLELFVDADPEGQVTATVPVRWHIHPDLVDELDTCKFTNPHILIVVRSLDKFGFGDVVDVIDRTNTEVHIVPLRQELTFVNFTRPGSNEIAATIIDVTKANATRIRNWLRNPRTVDLDYDGKPQGWQFRDYEIPYINIGAIMAVEVPREMFAPDPKPWKKRLVKAFFPSWEDDQCHFRKRLIGAICMSVAIQLYGLFARPAIALWLLYFGYRKVEWSRFWNVNPHALINERSKIDGTWWTRDKHGKLRSGWWKLISPIAPIVAFAVPATIFAIFNVFRKDGQPIVDWGWWKTVIIVDLAIVAIIVVIILIGLGVMARDAFTDKMDQAKAARSAEADTTSASIAERQRILTELRAMSLNRDTRTNLSALPLKKQTIVLRFYNLKARVCRPFAR